MDILILELHNVLFIHPLEARCQATLPSSHRSPHPPSPPPPFLRDSFRSTPKKKLILTYLSYLIPINYWKRSYNKENTKHGCAETLLHFLKKARIFFV